MSTNIIKGMAASPGIVEGRARLFFSGDSSSSFQEGDILVTTITDPTMVQAMVRAAAIVTDMGGITSHPAILSREMGIACVVNTKEATKVIRDGMKIRVDGSTGEVEVLDQAAWIDDFSRSAFRLFAGNTIDAFQPLDFYHFFPQWYELWLDRIVEKLERLRAEEKTFQELKHLLPPPSNLRAILIKIIPSYRAFVEKDAAGTKRVVEFLVRMLQESSPADPFAVMSNPYHREEEVVTLIGQLLWQEVGEGVARKLGQLNTAAGSLVHGLYNDVVTDLGWDVYGPYTVLREDQPYTMLIRHFPNLRPYELWPEEHLTSVRELMIYGLYQDVDWEIAFVGCHTIPKTGNPVQGLKKYVVMADGKSLSPEQIDALMVELSKKAETIYREIRALSFEDLKQKVLLQECYQLKKLFDAAGMDWRPTAEMRERVTGKPLLYGLLPRGVMMTDQAVFEETFGLREFAREVLGENT